MTEEQKKKFREIINSYIGDIAMADPYSQRYKYKYFEIVISLAKEVFNKDITEEEAKEIFNNACKVNNISSDSFSFYISDIIMGVACLYPTIVVSDVIKSILNYFDNGTTYVWIGNYFAKHFYNDNNKENNNK